MRKTLSLFALLVLSTVAYSQNPATTDTSEVSYVVLKNATLIDAVSDTGKKGSLLIKDERIEALSYDRPIAPPKGAVVYDLEGKYIIPGLIDAHVHITHGTLKEAQDQLQKALKAGITGVRDMGGDGRMLTLLQKNTKIGEDMGPDVFFSTIIAGPEFFAKDPRPQDVAKGAIAGEVPWVKAITDTTDLRQVIAEAKGLGATAIKVYLNIDKHLFKKVAAEAKRQDLKVWAHGVVPPTKPLDITNGGADVMSHVGSLIQYQMAKGPIKGRHDFESREKAAEWKAKLDAVKWDENTPEVVQLFDAMKKNQSILDATLFVYYYFKENLKNMKEDALRQVDAFRAVTIAYDMGVKIGAGSDHMISEDGTLNLHTELKLLTTAGLSNIDALRAATIVNAEGLGEEKQIGTIESGKLANLVILNTDPLENIENTLDIKYVVKRGVIIP
ncbi:amidohydrolase family protein [Zobellia uliginosa]|uniref:amidohydrolase family protein n=1 Tax=Zobellia uliginosa TaxID=143224 RepID=UPI0026E17B51|nr:amidohydrolase family protein [Zobellia uliginosa]MDO6516665.1 amidohydrolase family protein [Zobellia uliginosa]